MSLRSCGPIFYKSALPVLLEQIGEPHAQARGERLQDVEADVGLGAFDLADLRLREARSVGQLFLVHLACLAQTKNVSRQDAPSIESAPCHHSLGWTTNWRALPRTNDHKNLVLQSQRLLVMRATLLDCS